MNVKTKLTPAQCRAARGLLGWTQYDLSKEAGVGIVTVNQLEGGITQPRNATLDVIRRAFEASGVEFLDAGREAGVGVRLSKQK